MKKAVLLSSAVVLIIGCSSVQYKDASKDKGSKQWGPREVKTTVNTMVNSMYSYLKEEGKDSYIQVKRIKNETSEHIDTKMISQEIVTNLIKKKIKFISEEYTRDALEEMKKGMTGMIDQDSAIPAGELKSPNLYLYGDIRESTGYDKKKQRQYLVVTLTLKELRTGVQLWQEQQEFFKISKTDEIRF